MTKLSALSRLALLPTLLNRTSKRLRLTVALALIAIAAGAVVASASSAALGSLLFGGSQVTGGTVEHSPPSLPGNSVVATTLAAPPADGQLNSARRGHTATLLSDGQVLMVGGENADGFVTAAEVFDPALGSFSVSGNLSTPRADHTATKLDDGRVLIAGGRGALGPLTSTEIFDPASGAFTAGPNLIGARSGHSATSLTDGRIVIVGGDAIGSVEIYVPLLNAFAPAVANLSSPRAFHSAVVLKDRNILIVGGIAPDSSPVLSGEGFNVTSSTFSSVGNQTQDPHVRALLRVLPEGKVQIIGGSDHEDMEVYDPAINSFGAHAHVYPIGDSHPALLQEILDSPTRTALFHLGASSTLLNRTGQTITELPGSNQALVTGGVDSNGAFLNSASVLNSSPATISTDKLDYPPGTQVIVSGTGWQPNEIVTLMFHEDPHVDTENPHTFTVQADANGNFVCQEYAPEELDNGITFILAARGGSSGWTAQTAFTDTDPTPQTIPYSQDFSALPHSGAGSTTYPAGWQGWQLSTSGSSTSFRTSAATADLALIAGSSASTATGGVHNYNGKIGILATGGSDPSLALAINTTGHSNVTMSFDIMTIRNAYDGGSNTRINAVDLQYRVGTTGSFTSVSGLTNGIYQNNTTTQTGAGVTTPQKLESKSFMLPAAVDNQAVVQLRWLQRDVSGGGSRPSFAVDNIAITVVSPGSLQFSAANYDDPETNSGTHTKTVTVQRTGGSDGAVDVSYATSDGTATLADNDYLATSGTLHWNDGDSADKTFTVTVKGDTTYEANETVNLTLSAPTGGAFIGDTNPVTLTIQNDDSQPTISIDDKSQAEGNSGSSNFDFAVTLSNPSDQSITVHYSTADGTATQPGDYSSASGTLTFVPGDTSETVNVSVNGDTTFEGDETFMVNLDTPTNSTIADGTGLGTIQNDDSQPTVQFALASSSGAESASPVNLAVSLSTDTFETVTVNYAVNGSSTATGGGMDYTLLGTGTLTFNPGETSMNVTLTINDDSLDEFDETVIVDLSNSSNATLGATTQHPYTIQDNDPAPTVQFALASSAGDESSNASQEVTLSAPSGKTVMVNYAATGGTATSGGVDYTLTSGTVTFNPGDTSENVSFTVNDDNLDENDETVVVDLSAPGNATLGSPATHSYTIQDNDAAPIFTISDATLAEGNSSTTDFIFTVTKTGPTALTATVDYATANGTTNPATGGVACGTGIDYESKIGTLMFAPTDTTMTVTVKVCGESVSEANDTFFVNLSNATNASISDNLGVGTITNDDNVTYNFEGFFAPVDNPLTVNTVKAGSAVPVKWRLTTAGGTPVSDPNTFVGLFSYPVNCGTTDGLEAPVETVASGGSGLQYLGNGNWQINWKTLPNYPKGSCRVMELRLNDGTSHDANFKFK